MQLNCNVVDITTNNVAIKATNNVVKITTK